MSDVVSALMSNVVNETTHLVTNLKFREPMFARLSTVQ